MKPVALATIVCSKLIFEPSANEVTIAGFWCHFSAKARCVSGLRYGSWRPLTFPMTRGVSPMPCTQRTRFIWRPGSSPSHADTMTPARFAYTLRIGPSVASSSAFMRITCLPCSTASSTTWAPNSTEPVTSTRASICSARQSRNAIVGHHGAVGPDGVLDVGLGRCDHGTFERGVLAQVQTLLELAGVDGRHPHSGDAVRDLVREPAGHEAGADQGDAQRAALVLAAAQSGVDDDHSAALSRLAIRRSSSSLTSESGVHELSFSEISVTGSGQLRPRPGSNGDRPPSTPGV